MLGTVAAVLSLLQEFVHTSLAAGANLNARCGLMAGVKAFCVVLYPCPRSCRGLEAAEKQESCYQIRILCSAVEDENSFDRHAVAVLKSCWPCTCCHFCKT